MGGAGTVPGWLRQLRPSSREEAPDRFDDAPANRPRPHRPCLPATIGEPLQDRVLFVRTESAVDVGDPVTARAHGVRCHRNHVGQRLHDAPVNAVTRESAFARRTDDVYRGNRSSVGQPQRKLLEERGVPLECCEPFVGLAGSRLELIVGSSHSVRRRRQATL